MRKPLFEHRTGFWIETMPDGTEQKVAKLSSYDIRRDDESPLIEFRGLRLDRIEVRLTFDDFMNEHTYAMIRERYVPQLKSPTESQITITVEPRV